MKTVRFKDRFMNVTYWGYIAIKDPNRAKSTNGMTDGQFVRGYKGQNKSKFVGRNSIAYAAYVAGKEWKKRNLTPSTNG